MLAAMARGGLAIFTICSNNYLPMARVFFASAARYCPAAELFLCLADEVAASVRYPPNVTVVAAGELGIPDFRAFAFRYSIMEFNTALKPFMLRLLLARGYDAVLYFDPDIEIFAPLHPVIEPLRAGRGFVLTPHILRPAEADGFPDDMFIMRAGIYNLGFIGVAPAADTERILRWWSRRLRYDCVSEQERGVFVDQKFIDLLPAFTDSVHIARDSGCNVAYWNLRQRQLTLDGDQWRIDDGPLRFFHFSSINIDDLSCLAKWTAAFRGDEITPPLRALMRQYADRVIAAGHGEPAPPYSYGCFASGTPIPDAVRRMYRQRHLSFLGDPFETYEEYLHLPIAGQWAGSGSRMITNLMDDLRRREPVLLAHYDPMTREGVEGYTEWFLAHGHELLGDSRLIEPVAARAARPAWH